MTDIVAGSGNSVANILGVHNSELYFSAIGAQLWNIQADGTPTMVANLTTTPWGQGLGTVTTNTAY